jgi:outer membrane protein
MKTSARKLIAVMALAGLSSAAMADNWMMRVRAIGVAPDVDTDLAGLDVDTQYTGELDFTYFLTPNIGVELILATTRHEVELSGSSLGKVSVLPPTLTLQYHFNPKGQVNPYVGAGLNYTRFYNVDLPGFNIDENSWGGALQAGVDIAVTKNGYINLDVKKIWIGTEVTSGGSHVADLDIDPWVYGIGYGFRF